MLNYEKEIAKPCRPQRRASPCPEAAVGYGTGHG